MCSNKHWLNNLFILLLMLMPMVSYGDDWNQAVALDNKLYFYTYSWDNSTSESSYKLWVYDGSSDPSVLNDFENTSINNLQTVGSKLIINTYEYSSGSSTYSLWVYDPATDTLTEEENLGTSYASNFVVYNSKLYFTTSSYSGYSSYYYLYSYDGETKNICC